MRKNRSLGKYAGSRARKKLNGSYTPSEVPSAHNMYKFIKLFSKIKCMIRSHRRTKEEGKEISEYRDMVATKNANDKSRSSLETIYEVEEAEETAQYSKISAFEFPRSHDPLYRNDSFSALGDLAEARILTK